MAYGRPNMSSQLQLLSLFILFGSASLATEPSIRKIEFSVYGHTPVHRIEYMPVSESAVAAGTTPQAAITIETHSLARMGPHHCLGDGQIMFVEPTTKKKVARVYLPETSNQWLLIFIPNPHFKSDPNNHLKYLIYAYDDSPKNLPKNNLSFINLTGQTLFGTLGTKRIKLDLGPSECYPVVKSLPIHLWSPSVHRDKFLPALSETYRCKSDHRYLMILFPPVLLGAVDLDVRFLCEAVQ